MTFNEQIQKIYHSIFRRIKKYIIPFLLLFSFLSATSAMDIKNNPLFSRLELLTIHYTVGLLLLLSLIILLYHRLQMGKEAPDKVHSRPLRKLVNGAFFTLLGLLTFSGSLTFIKIHELMSWLPHQTHLLLFHHLLLWIFAPVLLVKLYLDSSSWANQLYWYLREH